MDIPTWAYDDVLRSASPSGLRLALALYRYGSAQVSDAGQRRCYWRGAKSRLARMAGMGLQALRGAIDELTDAGLVATHQTTAKRADVIAITAAVDRPRADENHQHRWCPPVGADDFHQHDTVETHSNLSPVMKIISTAESVVGAYMHDDAIHRDPDLSQSSSCIHAADDFHQRLAAVGVSDPDDWLRRWSRRDIAGALIEAAERPGVRNIGAFARTLLRNGYHEHEREPEPEPEPEPNPVPWDIQIVLDSPAWQYHRDRVNPLTRARVDEWLRTHPHLRGSPNGAGDDGEHDEPDFDSGEVL